MQLASARSQHTNSSTISKILAQKHPRQKHTRTPLVVTAVPFLSGLSKQIGAGFGRRVSMAFAARVRRGTAADFACGEVELDAVGGKRAGAGCTLLEAVGSWEGASESCEKG